ncbi:TPA: phage gp6-like head-tail connector protein [Escherichia coli]|nr:phage gp6-like head-tail connector protein [Escherichia coli]
MLLTMEEIKAQLRLDEDFDADDRHLQLLACAAQKRTETYLNRKLYAPDDIRLGMLMLISHFYENRSSVTDVEKMELPMSFNWLVGPYRYFPQ